MTTPAPSVPDPDARYRLTLRGPGLELRGWCDSWGAVGLLADAVQPLGVQVLASPAAADYNPFHA